MRPVCFSRFRQALAAAALFSLGLAAHAEPSHGIAMYGAPALPEGFTHLPYVNPDAPKGGRIVWGETGGFDSLNPFIRKGRVPWYLRFVTHESLLARSYDEPFTLYPLLATSVETAPDRSWVEFTLNPDARFSDGSAVTVEDVIWSYELLGTQGHPRYLSFWKKVASIESPAPLKVRITFNVEDHELALIAGLRPILQKAQWEGKDFAEAEIQDIPIGSGAYVVDNYEPNRFVSLRRNPDYWGADLPMRRGTQNFDEIRMEFFGDAGVQFEALKAGELSVQREWNAEKWARDYTFPRVQSGEMLKSIIPHNRPTGITGYVMNTRKPPFDDWRVREAMIRAFNFEYINDTITGGRQSRITSYFANSVLAMHSGPATGLVRDYLTPYSETLLPGTLEGYELPQSNGSQRDRKNMRVANRLLEEAGWTVENGRRVNAEGESMDFEILLRQGNPENKATVDIYRKSLETLGIFVDVAIVDSAQFRERTNAMDFDMTYYRRALSLSPGNEQYLYWGSQSADQQGSRNWMGVRSEAVDAMIDRMISAQTRDEARAATRALDRLLTAGRYVIPIHYNGESRLVHDSTLHFPETTSMYGDWIGFMPDTWWYEAR